MIDSASLTATVDAAVTPLTGRLDRADFASAPAAKLPAIPAPLFPEPLTTSLSSARRAPPRGIPSAVTLTRPPDRTHAALLSSPSPNGVSRPSPPTTDTGATPLATPPAKPRGEAVDGRRAISPADAPGCGPAELPCAKAPEPNRELCRRISVGTQPPTSPRPPVSVGRLCGLGGCGIARRDGC